MRPSMSSLHLRALARQYPDEESVLGAMTALSLARALPAETIHVVSDVHGEANKLSHVIRNASGSLRPRVGALFDGERDQASIDELLSIIYYPREALLAALSRREPAAQHAFVRETVAALARVARSLAERRSVRALAGVVPDGYVDVFRELVLRDGAARDDVVDALVVPHLAVDGGLRVVRTLSRAVRNLAVDELIVAGDLGDRGPRIDAVIALLKEQPRVSIAWGNHDASWLGACLGQQACVATVVRISLRYGRTAQLEEGYGIPLGPVERLAREVYGDDPCERFQPKAHDLRDAPLLAKMQKAIAIVEQKLVAQTSRRNPAFGLGGRELLHAISRDRATVVLDGVSHPMRDRRLPTVDPDDPYALSPAERACIDQLTASFVASPRLWDHMQFVADRGSMLLLRDDVAIFHGCVPCDEAGELATVDVLGRPLRGRALLDELSVAVHRAVREQRPLDLDLLYWLWAGPTSPLFGKDKMATFEGYFIADETTHHETKNPYFKLIHERDFALSVLAELGLPTGLIVNGHVPVKLDRGEEPVKRSGLAVTIDGAFSEAYGDRGYTLILDQHGTHLARHHHFESVEETILRGADIVPVISTVRRFERARRVADTREGKELDAELEVLGDLLLAYRDRRAP